MKFLRIAVFVFIASCTPNVSEQFEPAAPLVLNKSTFAGRTENREMFGAVLTHERGINAYFCDGQRGFWFRGDSGNSVANLATEGAQLLVQILDDGAVGLLTVGDTVTKFDLPVAQGEPLMRAEMFEGETRVLGGWIRLADGEQRGTVLINAQANASTLLGAGVVCSGCGERLTIGLTPAPFTPATAIVTENKLAHFTVLGLGDSYMSGEGAPNTKGVHRDDGTVVTAETWSPGLPANASPLLNGYSVAEKAVLKTEAQACHRGLSGLDIAITDLQRRWMTVDVVYQNFACSGAVTGDLTTNSVSGHASCSDRATAEEKRDCFQLADDLPSPGLIRPQLTAAREFLARQRLHADAVVMSIGGNNFGFGDLVKECIVSDCSTRASTLPARASALAASYASLATSLQARVLPANTFLASYPFPLSKGASSSCAGDDFSDVLLSGGTLVPDALFTGITAAESTFAGTMLGSLNGAVASAVTTHGWKPITSHLASVTGHGVCTTDRWFNGIRDAVRTQGADRVTPLPLVDFGKLSFGMVHPNDLGHRNAYAPAYLEALSTHLEAFVKPRPPRNFRPVSFAVENGRRLVTFQWDDVNTSEFKHIISSPTLDTVVEVAGDVTQAVFDMGNAGGDSFTIQACAKGPFGDAGGPSGQDTKICSAKSAPVAVAAVKPKHIPTNVGGTSPFPGGSLLTWQDISPDRIFSTVEVEAAGGLERYAVASNQLSITYAGNRRFRVAACNNLGCGFPSQWTTIGEAPPTIDIPKVCKNGPPTVIGCR
jgi:hypothetical protein